MKSKKRLVALTTLGAVCSFGGILASTLIFNQNKQPIYSKLQNTIQNQTLNTRWIKGVNVSQDEFFHIVDNDLDFYATINQHNRGWFDINKEFDGQDTWLCSGIVATNMLHWWLEQNNEYVQKYLEISDQKGIINIANIKKDIRDLKQTYEKDGYVDQSSFFDFLKSVFPTKTLFPDKVLDTYINGYFFSNKPNKNEETKRRIKRDYGFFSEVFNEKKLTDFNYVYNKKSFSNLIKQALEKNRAMAVSYFGSSQGIGHIVSIWGADFNDQGEVEAVYITDSDDNSKRIPDNNKKIGIIRYRVIEDPNGGIKLSSYIDDNSGAKVANLYTFDLGVDLWNKYFENHNKMLIQKPQIKSEINNQYNEFIARINDEINNDSLKLSLNSKVNEINLKTLEDFENAVWEEEVQKVYDEFNLAIKNINIIESQKQHSLKVIDDKFNDFANQTNQDYYNQKLSEIQALVSNSKQSIKDSNNIQDIQNIQAQTISNIDLISQKEYEKPIENNDELNKNESENQSDSNKQTPPSSLPEETNEVDKQKENNNDHQLENTSQDDLNNNKDLSNDLKPDNLNNQTPPSLQQETDNTNKHKGTQNKESNSNNSNDTKNEEKTIDSSIKQEMNSIDSNNKNSFVEKQNETKTIILATTIPLSLAIIAVVFWFLFKKYYKNKK